MYKCTNLGMARPMDKYLIIWSLKILFEIMRVWEIFKGDNRFFSKKSRPYFFLHYIANKIENWLTQKLRENLACLPFTK